METTFIREISVNYKAKAQKMGATLREASEVAPVLRGLLPDNSREHFLALYLNGAHEVIAYSVVSTGSANSAPVQVREVYQPALIAGALALIVGHNHPSGKTAPSQEDRGVTKRLKEAGELIGIKLLDHLIITDTEYRSFAESGEL